MELFTVLLYHHFSTSVCLLYYITTRKIMYAGANGLFMVLYRYIYIRLLLLYNPVPIGLAINNSILSHLIYIYTLSLYRYKERKN